MPDLSTSYLGLNLRSPLVASASPLSRDLDTLKRLEEAGAAAVVMYSLFEEQILHESRALDHYLSQHANSFSEAMSYFPEPREFRLGPDKYLEHIHAAKQAVRIPIIGSLNGVSTGGWVKYARLIEEAGADALELNTYFLATDPELTAGTVEDMYADLVADVRRSVKIPLAVKLSPFFSALPNTARRLVQAGAQGLVLFNRFYQPDLDIENLEVVPRLTLSTSHDLQLPLRWIAILCGRVPADLALTSGVHTVQDVLKGLMAGAAVTMMASELLHHGIGRLGEIERDLVEWMETHEYDSVARMHGSMSQVKVEGPAAFERAHYVRIVGTLDPSKIYTP